METRGGNQTLEKKFKGRKNKTKQNRFLKTFDKNYEDEKIDNLKNINVYKEEIKELSSE